MTDTPPTGTVLQATKGVERMPLAQMNVLDPSDAAAETLACYLEKAVFCIAGTPDQMFRLDRAIRGWPENFQELKYPVASIVPPTVMEDAHSLTPTALEETLDRYCPETVLWKTGELAINLQLDFWCTDRLQLRAIAAALGELFNPCEDFGGVRLQGPPEYWSLPIRYTLVSHHRDDKGDTVQARQRRLTVLVLADVDVVQLRKAARLSPRIWVNGEPAVLESAGPA